MKNKNAFVTGANGFVGSHLVKLLVDQGIDTTAFILKGTDCKLLEILHPSLKNVKIIEGDILDKESITNHIKEMHFVFHLAGVLQGYTQEDYDKLNVQGTQNVLEACLDFNPDIERLIICSSTAAAGSGTDENPLKEDDKAKPLERDYYGISKYKMECLTSTFKDDLPISIVRPCSVLGPGNRINLDLYKTLKLGIKLKILGPYRPLSFIDVRDLVEGIYQCAI
ncbi:MAG: NAD(P)-dependent oxidoreductase, partial [Candidatus Heimdallarchaeota archaeon]|nr:NAD(P)-dependent oxidoreductase [Candidatus Heimdallarchaeota archaeon]MCK4954644.1 NAD(P)-dependent oxidoreductase [Candidatus Heimdallarchaeota archaeon]